MAPTIRERLQQFQEIHSSVQRLQLEQRIFKQKAAECQWAAVTQVQKVVMGVQESDILVQETALSQEFRKLAEEALARAQEAERLANVVEAELQKARELAAYFQGKVVFFHNRDEATAIANLRSEYHITLQSRSTVHMDPGADRAELREFARGLNII